METTAEQATQADATVTLAAETMRGDIRDLILDDIARQMPCWASMTETEQRRVIGRADQIAMSVVRDSIAIVAHRGFGHLVVSTGKWTVKDGIKLEVGASGSVDDITKLAEHGARSAVLVLAEPSVYFGQRADAVADKDQPDLPIHDEDGVIVDPAGASADENDQADAAEDDDGDAASTDRSPLPDLPAEPTRSRRRAPAPADA